jgi:16S rRNA (guanine527-N7)-methyltransferase
MSAPEPRRPRQAPRAGVPAFSRPTLLVELRALAETLTGHGVELPEEVPEAFVSFLERLFRFSEHTNVVAAQDLADIVRKHVAPSLLPLLAPEIGALPAGTAAVDIGSGGGFPGLVLAIGRPRWRFTLIESVQKKARFLAEASASLGNVEVCHARAESVSLGGHVLGRCSLVTARAVGPPDRTWPLARRFLAPTGQFHVWVPRAAETEIRARVEKTHRDALVLAPIEPDFYPGALMRLSPRSRGRG